MMASDGMEFSFSSACLIKKLTQCTVVKLLVYILCKLHTLCVYHLYWELVPLAMHLVTRNALGACLSPATVSAALSETALSRDERLCRGKNKVSTGVLTYMQSHTLL